MPTTPDPALPRLILKRVRNDCDAKDTARACGFIEGILGDLAPERIPHSRLIDLLREHEADPNLCDLAALERIHLLIQRLESARAERIKNDQRPFTRFRVNITEAGAHPPHREFVASHVEDAEEMLRTEHAHGNEACIIGTRDVLGVTDDDAEWEPIESPITATTA